MILLLRDFAFLSALFAASVQGGYDPALVGTWSTKTRAVVTGPNFYNPVTDTLLEPALTGISYSFTIDGYYEEAYYRAISNPTTPSCPSGIMQWQHGTYSLPGNGSIILEPFEPDGRQLLSSPCSYDQSVYTRYYQPELFLSYESLVDPYHNVQRLNLFQFDGSPMNPMFLVYDPPQMLPTETLNPTASGTAAPTGKSRVMQRAEQPAERSAGQTTGSRHRQQQQRLRQSIIQKPNSQLFNADRWWWVGVGLTALGTVMYMMPSSS